MKEEKKVFAQSCNSRECRKKHKDEITEMCEAVTTVHTFDPITKEVTCTECGKSYKLTQ